MQAVDPAGQPFRIRGVNRLHWDSDSAAGIQKSGANAVRWDIDFTRAATDNVDLIQTQSIHDRRLARWTACRSESRSTLSVAGRAKSIPSAAALTALLNAGRRV